MATVKHTNWLQLMLGGTGSGTVPDFDLDDLDVSLLDQTNSGTITAATAVYDTVDSPTVVATAETTITVTAGVATLSGPVTFTAVTGPGGIVGDYLTLFKNSGTPSTSPLIITWDSTSTGLPVTPNGGDIVATWSSNILVTLS